MQFEGFTTLAVFPNPTSDYIRLGVPVNGLATVRILNNIGEVIREVDYNQNQEIDVSSLLKGVYYVELKSDQEIETVKFYKL